MHMGAEFGAERAEVGCLLLDSGQVRARLGRISAMALWRWRRDPGLDFPVPLNIKRRNYWRADELAAWIQGRGRLRQVGPGDGTPA